jgi:hypothetical protein
MLPGQVTAIDEALLTSVCKEHWSESQTLDFKRTLPGTDEKGKNEFRKDVCAFANASGGDLVYGVQEKPAGQADQIVPIPIATHAIDATKRHLAQILEGGLEPPLPGVVMQPVLLASSDYVLVVRVPASFQRPHRYWLKDYTRWVVRAETHIVDLTYEQIRDSFDRGATLAERARRFRDERLTGVVSGTTGRHLRAGPRCVVHLIPLASVAGRAAVDIGPLYYNGYQEFMFQDWGGAARDFNLDGLVVYPGREAADITYTQIFRSGALEMARWAGMLHVQDEADKTAIPSSDQSILIREAFVKFLAAASRWRVTGPAIAAVAMLGVEGYRLWYVSQRGITRRQQADRPNLILPEILIEQLGAVDKPDQIARPLLDTLWQAFGFERCLLYDSAGNWPY